MLTYYYEETFLIGDKLMVLFKKARVPLDDSEIIDLYWQRDEKAIDETDFKYRKYLFTIAYNILYSNEDSEECLDDTYVGAWNTIPPERPSYLKAYLTTIIRRVSINKYNEKNRNKRVPSNMTESLDDIGDIMGENTLINEIQSEQLGKAISDYLRTLSKRQRYIFMSRYYVADSIDKIASELNVSKSTVNKEIALIKSGLKAALEREGYTV